MDLVKLDRGVFVYPTFPPYRMVLGYETYGKEIDFESIEEIEFLIRKLQQLRDFANGMLQSENDVN